MQLRKAAELDRYQEEHDEFEWFSEWTPRVRETMQAWSPGLADMLRPADLEPALEQLIRGRLLLEAQRVNALAWRSLDDLCSGPARPDEVLVALFGGCMPLSVARLAATGVAWDSPTGQALRSKLGEADVDTASLPRLRWRVGSVDARVHVAVERRGSSDSFLIRLDR